MRNFILYTSAFLLLLLLGSCFRKRCDGEGDIQQSYVNASNWQWFFPEGKRIPYENNLGEKDTAVFGPVEINNEKGYFDDKNCRTTYTQKMTQEIRWTNNLRDWKRPRRLEGKFNSTNLYFDNPYIKELFEKNFKDSIQFKNNMLKDVSKSTCDSKECLFKSSALSQKNFYIEFTYQTSKDSPETWTQK